MATAKKEIPSALSAFKANVLFGISKQTYMDMTHAVWGLAHMPLSRDRNANVKSGQFKKYN